MNLVSVGASVDISPVTLDNQLSSVVNDDAPPSPDLLADTQGIIPGTELPPLPPVDHAHSHDSSSEGKNDDSTDDDFKPVAENTPTKTTGEDVSQSDLEIEMGQTSESPFKTDYCIGQFHGKYDMAAEDFSFHEHVMHHLGGW